MKSVWCLKDWCAKIIFNSVEAGESVGDQRWTRGGIAVALTIMSCFFCFYFCKSVLVFVLLVTTRQKYIFEDTLLRCLITGGAFSLLFGFWGSHRGEKKNLTPAWNWQSDALHTHHIVSFVCTLVCWLSPFDVRSLKAQWGISVYGDSLFPFVLKFSRQEKKIPRN